MAVFISDKFYSDTANAVGVATQVEHMIANGANLTVNATARTFTINDVTFPYPTPSYNYILCVCDTAGYECYTCLSSTIAKTTSGNFGNIVCLVDGIPAVITSGNIGYGNVPSMNISSDTSKDNVISKYYYQQYQKTNVYVSLSGIFAGYGAVVSDGAGHDFVNLDSNIYVPHSG